MNLHSGEDVLARASAVSDLMALLRDAYAMLI